LGIILGVIMNKNVSFLLIFIFSFVGCVTIQTQIDDRDNYNEIQIETKRRFLLFFDISIGNYRIEDRNRTVNKFEGNSGKILIREGYTFYEGLIPTSRIEFVQRETRGFIFTTIRQFIRITDKNGRTIEHEVNLYIGESNYITIQDKNDRVIKINNITDGFHTGFDIIVDNEIYGILAFYPVPFKRGSRQPSFFYRKDKKLDSEIVMYILAVYLSDYIW
jgi:hypothetical protein